MPPSPSQSNDQNPDPGWIQGHLVLTVAEAAALLRVSVKSIYKAVKNGKLPVVRIGRTIRIPVHALKQTLERSAPADRDDER